MPNTAKPATPRREPPFRLRRSRIHGTGVFATRAIRKGKRIIEYLGERITQEEADRRAALKEVDDGHTFLFTIDAKCVIDAGVDGNAARFINHSCEPNCEAVLDDRRIFIEAVRTIAPGEELVYDYNIGRDPDDPPNVEQIFGCRCGSASCRGTMVTPLEKKRSPSPKRKKAAARSNGNAKANGNGKTKRPVKKAKTGDARTASHAR